jgi:hypothetical protein
MRIFLAKFLSASRPLIVKALSTLTALLELVWFQTDSKRALNLNPAMVSLKFSTTAANKLFILAKPLP